MIDRPPYLFSPCFQASVSRFLERGRNALYSVLFPFECAGCSVLLPYPEAMCGKCAASLKTIVAPFCKRCGIPFPPQWTVKRCAVCITQRSAVTRTRSVYPYEGLVRKAIRSAKYRGKARFLRFFAEQMFVAGTFFSNMDAVVPVPLHRKREWRRRFNQARILVNEYSRLSGLPVWDRLVKTKLTVSQSSLSGLARRMNLKGAFACAGGVAPPRVLLIDDVITTGATIEECARTLRRNGAKKVYALSIARAVKKF